MRVQLMQYASPNGTRRVLVRRMARGLGAVEIDAGGLSLRRLSIGELAYMVPLPCEPADAIAHFISAGRQFGQTRAAAALIAAAQRQPAMRALI